MNRCFFARRHHGHYFNLFYRLRERTSSGWIKLPLARLGSANINRLSQVVRPTGRLPPPADPLFPFFPTPKPSGAGTLDPLIWRWHLVRTLWRRLPPLPSLTPSGMHLGSCPWFPAPSAGRSSSVGCRRRQAARGRGSTSALC